MLLFKNIFPQLQTKDVAGNYAVLTTDDCLNVDASSNGVVTLPLASVFYAQAAHTPLYIKKIDSSANAVTITPSGSDTIDGASTWPLVAQYDAAVLFTDGVNWFVYGYITGASGGGVTTITAFGNAPNANGGSISGANLTLQPASAAFPGGVSTGVQSFAGNKTFTGTIAASNLSGTNTGDQTITLTGDVTGSGTGSFATILATVNANVGTFTAATITVNAKGLVTAASSGSAVTTLGAVDNNPNANAAIITGNTLQLEPASAAFPGVVSTGVQSFAGNKTFTGTIAASNLSGTNTGDQTITLTGDVTGTGTGTFAATLATVNANVGTFNAAKITVNGKGLITAASVGLNCNEDIFSVSMAASSQSIGGSVTLINFDTVGVDTQGAYTTATKRYTPKVAGYYRFSIGIEALDGSNVGSQMDVYLYKNGSVYSKTSIALPLDANLNASANNSNFNNVVLMNGSTDFVDARADDTERAGSIFGTNGGIPSSFFSGQFLHT